MLASEAIDKLERQFGKRVAPRLDEYRSILEKLPQSEIDVRWASVMGKWAKSTPPPPGNFAVEPKRAAGKNSAGEWPWEERSRKIRERTEVLCKDFFRDNQQVVRQARDEGWLMDLRAHLWRKAHMIAQLESPPPGWPDPPNYPIAWVNQCLKTPGHDWLTDEDVAVFRGRVETRRYHVVRWGVEKEAA